MAKAQGAAYGAGSMTEKAPSVWRLQCMVSGRQVERTFSGTEAAARKQLRQIADDPAKDGRAAPSTAVRRFTRLNVENLGISWG